MLVQEWLVVEVLVVVWTTYYSMVNSMVVVQVAYTTIDFWEHLALHFTFLFSVASAVVLLPSVPTCNGARLFTVWSCRDSKALLVDFLSTLPGLAVCWSLPHFLLLLTGFVTNTFAWSTSDCACSMRFDVSSSVAGVVSSTSVFSVHCLRPKPYTCWF